MASFLEGRAGAVSFRPRPAAHAATWVSGGLTHDEEAGLWEQLAGRRQEEQRVREHARERRIIRGTFDASVACTRSCKDAWGEVCTCSCGGQNHGMNHDAELGPRQVVKAR
jgi:hypothetical protein